MDARFREIYAAIYVGRTGQLGQAPFFPDDLYGGFAGWRWSRGLPYFGEVIRDAIERAEREHGRVREDAKALLAVNFQDLIVLPLSIGGRAPLDSLAEDIRQDIAMLVGGAAEVSEQDEDGISGHAVLDALSRSWDRLRISRYRLWERSGGE